MKRIFLDSEYEVYGGCDDPGENADVPHAIVVESEKWRRRESKIKYRRKAKEASNQNVSLT